MGAVLAAGLASGVDEDTLLARLAEVGRRGIVRDPLATVTGLFSRGLLRPAPLRLAIEALFPARRFADLHRPLTVSVVDLDSGELLLFGAGGADAPLIDVLCATCALPLYFPAQTAGGRRYGDGGLRGVVPLDVAARFAGEPVVAIDVGPGFEREGDGDPNWVPPMVRAHEDALGILMAAHTAAQVALWRCEPGRPPLIYVRPRVDRRATFRVEHVRRYAQDGYQATRAVLEQWVHQA
jgi:NTE family protein